MEMIRAELLQIHVMAVVAYDMIIFRGVQKIKENSMGRPLAAASRASSIAAAGGLAAGLAADLPPRGRGVGVPFLSHPQRDVLPLGLIGMAGWRSPRQNLCQT